MNEYNSNNSYASAEEKINTEAQLLLEEIKINKQNLKELKASSGVTGREDFKTLKAMAAEGNVVAAYYYALSLKATSVSGTSYDSNTLALLKNIADNGYAPAASEYGVALLKENNASEGLNYVIEAAKCGEPDAIYALADFYNNYATTQKDKDEYKKFLTASALWYKVGLELGVEKIVMRSVNYDRMISSLNSGSRIGGSSKQKKEKKEKEAKSSSFSIDSKLIILIVVVILLLVFFVGGIIFLWPYLSNLLGLNNGSENNNDTSLSPSYSIDFDDEDEDYFIADIENDYEYEFNFGDEEIQVEIEIPAEIEEEEEIIEEPEIEESKYTDYIITANSGLHLRRGPDTDEKSIIIMDKGDIIQVELIENGWAKAKYGVLEGWCKADYIELLDNINGDNGDIPELDTEYMHYEMYVLAENGLRLREKPNLNANIIILMPYCSEVYVYDDSDVDWYKVQYHENGRVYTGWCSREFLDFVDPSYYTDIETRREYYFIDQSSGEFLYLNPSSTSRKIAHVVHTKLYYLYETDDGKWAYVKCDENFNAYDYNERELENQPKYVLGWIESKYLW